MPAYLLLVFAILTRVVPHHGWLNFTAVGGMLLYFGARRSWRELLAPLAALMVTDYCLTVFAYHYSFVWTAYDPAEAVPTTADDVAGVGVPARVSRWVRCPVAKIVVPPQVPVLFNDEQHRGGGEEDLEPSPTVSDHIA